MPRGKFVNHKGRNRRFTSPEELQQQDEEESSSEESSSEEDDQPSSSKARGPITKFAAPGKMPTSSEDSEEETKKGVASLIRVKNPNRQAKDVLSDLTKLNLESNLDLKPELSRQDLKQLAKQKARERYEKLHAAGKTFQAKADLARLALIKQQREDAAAKREAGIKKKANDEKNDSEK